MTGLKKFCFWVILFAVCLEIFFQLGGGVFSWLEERQNRAKLKNDHGYRVLCLGDSLTEVGGQDSYPSQMEAILNAQAPGSHFVVINKGIAGTGPNHIVSHIDEYTMEYAPDVVVMMSGMNDDYSPARLKKNEGAWRTLKVRRMAESLWPKIWSGLQAQMPRLGFAETAPKQMEINDYLKHMTAYVSANPSTENYTRLAYLYRAAYKKSEALECAVKALQLNPANHLALRLIAEHYLAEKNHAQAIPVLVQYLQVAPASEHDGREFTYLSLDQAFIALGQRPQLRAFYRYAMTAFPFDHWPFSNLAALLFEDQDYAGAKEVLTQEILHHPDRGAAYEQLTKCLLKLGETDAARRVIAQGLRRKATGSINLYYILANLLVKDGNPKDAQPVLEEGLDLRNVADDELKNFPLSTHELDFYELLIQVYTLNGKPKRAAALHSAVDALKERKSNAYWKILHFLRGRDIPLVAVQYPLEELKALQEKLPPGKGLFFVDNEALFKKAVAQNGYFYYFADSYGGKYGHCTPKGNHLLAENVAKTVLEVKSHAHVR